MREGAFLVKSGLLIYLILFLSQSSLEYGNKQLSSFKVEAMRLIPVSEDDQKRRRTWMMRKKMLAALDTFDGCGCYSDDDCKNSPGCGSYCSSKIDDVIGICRQSGLVQQ